MKELIEKLMRNNYWKLLEMGGGGNCFVGTFATPTRTYINVDRQVDDTLRAEFLLLVMMGFYPLSHSILLAFRQIEKLAPNDNVREKARFFVEVEEGKLAASDWYRGVAHSELYRRMFSSLSPTPLEIHEQMLEQYQLALKLEEGGLARALVTAAFIEKTGLTVLHLLHDFVAQWQVCTGKPTSVVDLTYLNEHMLHEGEESADQHVCIIDQMMYECGTLAMQKEIKHFEVVTDKWLTHIHERVSRMIEPLSIKRLNF